MAEREGCEPSVPGLPVQLLSRQPCSTTPASLRGKQVLKDTEKTDILQVHLELYQSLDEPVNPEKYLQLPAGIIDGFIPGDKNIYPGGELM